MVIDEPETYVERFAKRGGYWLLFLALALLAGSYFLFKSPGALSNLPESKPETAVAQPSAVLPELNGRVVDRADLLPATVEARLTESLAALEERTTDQLVVVTVPSLRGESIEAYGLRLGNTWQIGQAKANNGVLLILAPNERKVRIEVGSGLENVLTNDICAQIIQDDILQAFKAGRTVDGITSGVTKIDAILRANPNRPARGKLKGRLE
jgi:uncharacterized protein